MNRELFKPGQEVWILGRYRAIVVQDFGDTVECDVYEGLAPGQEAPQRLRYDIGSEPLNKNSLVSPERWPSKGGY
jgi:hypothetical protein